MYEEFSVDMGPLNTYTGNEADVHTYLVLEGKAAFEIVDQGVYEEATKLENVTRQVVKQTNAGRFAAGQPYLTAEEKTSIKEEVTKRYEDVGPEGVVMQNVAYATKTAAMLYQSEAVGDLPQKMQALMQEKAMYEQTTFAPEQNKFMAKAEADYFEKHPEKKEIMQKCHDREQELLAQYGPIDAEMQEKVVDVAMAAGVSAQAELMNYINAEPALKATYDEITAKYAPIDTELEAVRTEYLETVNPIREELSAAWDAHIENIPAMKEKIDGFETQIESLTNELSAAMGALYADFKDNPETIFSKLDMANKETKLEETLGIKAIMPTELDLTEFPVSDTAIQSAMMSTMMGMAVSPVDVQKQMDEMGEGNMPPGKA